MTNKDLQPTKWVPRGPYSLGVQLGNMVFLSGQIAQDNEGNAIGAGDVREQTRVVIRKIKDILALSGMGLDDVVSTTVYLQSLEDYKAMNEIYSAEFGKPFPARATVRADLAGDGLLVEISAIAGKT